VLAGEARRGLDWRGLDWKGVAGVAGSVAVGRVRVWRRRERHGKAWQARHGLVGKVLACSGAAGTGMAGKVR
jgi:hypothetical protein